MNKKTFRPSWLGKAYKGYIPPKHDFPVIRIKGDMVSWFTILLEQNEEFVREWMLKYKRTTRTKETGAHYTGDSGYSTYCVTTYLVTTRTASFNPKRLVIALFTKELVLFSRESTSVTLIEKNLNLDERITEYVEALSKYLESVGIFPLSLPSWCHPDYHYTYDGCRFTISKREREVISSTKMNLEEYNQHLLKSKGEKLMKVTQLATFNDFIGYMVKKNEEGWKWENKAPLVPASFNKWAMARDQTFIAKNFRNKVIYTVRVEDLDQTPTIVPYKADADWVGNLDPKEYEWETMKPKKVPIIHPCTLTVEELERDWKTNTREYDEVNNPSHYTSGGIEPIKYIQSHKMNYEKGNVIKYITRAGKKKGQSEIKDLKKAMKYIGLLIEDIEKYENS